MEDTVFTKIIKGEIPCHKVAENDKFIAFLDISPIAVGHTLVVTKLQNDYIFDLPDDLLGEMMVFAKKVAVAMRKVFVCKRIGMAVLGLDVPHNHIHLVPLNREDDLDFKAPRHKMSDKQFAETAAKIADAVIL